MHRDYAPRGVQFFYIYKTLAHPELNGLVEPFTLEERLLHVREAEQRTGSRIRWLSDTMDNRFKAAMGRRPNSEFIVDPEGKIVRMRDWSNPQQLRRDLVELVGPVDPPTDPQSLAMPAIEIPTVAPQNIVPRVPLPAGGTAVRVLPQQAAEPYYVKLRAVVDRDLLSSGTGKLHLGFHLDPLYHVHWNNLVQPIRYRIAAAEGITLTPAEGTGPEVDAPTDADPREFLIQVNGTDEQPGPLEVTVEYFACNDAEGWCKPVAQRYLVFLERDPEAGSPIRRRQQFGE